ncbi:transposase [Rivularia sp. UHCC 0363]|uniref:RNA-guided endonuclease InsQ/TnpB family protein n=1 Tax=Rivularia sp. UHCC 0363 TaxID=3110244 RepID=UPI002B20597C|nr:transposase [Rivularia sp. UHCC 0363]MEA5599131.1 transposase [Rivularia sp. UHCC 0363]
MEQTLTLACKLQPTPEQSSQIEALLKAFADGCNFANEQVNLKTTSKTTIQSQVYQQLREKFGLSANQAVRVCARVGASRKAAKSKGEVVKEFRPTSADYDARIFAFREKDWTVSLTLLNGREHIKLDAGNYQRGKLKGRKPTSAQLCKHRDGGYYIHIALTDEVPDPIKSDKVIGVDLGRRDIAVTSEGDSWSGKDIQQVRDRYARVRASLQQKASKGTRSTRRRARQILKRLSGREQRYQTWLNHNISKVIVLSALRGNAIIAVEDLTGIRERTNEMPRSKTERRRSNSWAFYQLRLFLSYKGIKWGVELIAVNPAYTSQTCSECLHIHPVRGKSYRSGKSFKCGHCGNHCDADANGSKMISIVGGAVSLLGGSVLSCNLEDHIRATKKQLTLGVGESPRTLVGG